MPEAAVQIDRTMKWLGASSAGAAGEPAPSVQLHHPSANGHIPTVRKSFDFPLFCLRKSANDPSELTCDGNDFTRDRDIITYLHTSRTQ